jgi:hypothetical protein
MWQWEDADGPGFGNVFLGDAVANRSATVLPPQS